MKTEAELEKEFEKEFELLSEIGYSIGVSRSVWCADLPDNLDFSLQFSNSVVEFTNRQGGETYILVKPTYSDIWKAFEKSLIDIGPTDHIFIEDIQIDNGILKIHTGS